MNYKNHFLLFLILFVFTNLNNVFSQNKNSFFTGSITQNSFVEEIPFDLVEGQIVIKVNIKDNIYHFLFDTGAPVVVDNQIAKLLNKSKDYQNVFDSNGNIQKLPKRKINELKIGNIVFKNITTFVTDLKYIKEIGCINIQGVIGANLMTNAVWQINYAQKKIIFTNNVNSLHLATDNSRIKFSLEKIGTPIIPIYIDETKVDNVIIDTGSRGSIIISKNDVQNIHKDVRSITNYTLNPGAFGVELDTIQTYKCNNILIGDNRKVIIGKIYINSSADLKGIKIFDEVLRVNDINCENLSNDDYCLLKRDAFNSNKIKITIKRNTKELDLILIKSDLFKESE